MPHAGLSSDEEFFRRIHIDLTGRLPQDEQLRAFLASSDPDKRDKLIDQLATSRPYETKWTYFFNDIYKPAPGRIGNTAKNVFYLWVRDNIHLDRPYNEIVYEMLTSNATSNWYIGPASYVARWVITAVACEDEVHEDTSDELAVHAAKDFLGVDISCASCHDGARHLEKINLYLSQRKREEIWKMAAFFGRTNVLRRTEVSTAQDEYSIDDNGPGYDPSARSVIRVPRRGKPGLLEPVYMFTASDSGSGEASATGIRAPADVGSTVRARHREPALGRDVRCRHCRASLRFRPGASRSEESAAGALGPATVASGTARSARAVFPRQQLQHPIGVEADREVQCVSALVAVPGRVEGELCAVLCAQVRAPAESGGSLRLARGRDERLHRRADPRHRRQSRATRPKRTHRTSSSGA